jgi:hypothetical protein
MKDKSRKWQKAVWFQGVEKQRIHGKWTMMIQSTLLVQVAPQIKGLKGRRKLC